MLPTKLLIITLLSIFTFNLPIESLPITSKPIESTAENLAWEAWLMVPVGQQLKTRKVTPKSIFIVPQKKNQTAPVTCPPGEHYYESRCIPTVNIDTDKILLTQLTNLVYPTGDYDYDYDETGSDLPGAEKFEGETEQISTSVLDTADEPLKFDIFRDNFPIGSSGSGDSSGIKDTDDDQFFYVEEHRRRPPLHLEGPFAELDVDNSSQGTYNETSETDKKDNEAESTVFLSKIDAILVPAGSTNEGNLNFSVYREVVNSTVPTKIAEMERLSSITEKNKDLEKILEDESLILDEGHGAGGKEIITTTERIETATDLPVERITTPRIEDEYDNAEEKMEYTRSIVEETSVSPLGAAEITSTLMEKETDITTTFLSNDESTTITDQPKEETTETISLKDETTTIESASPIEDKGPEGEVKKTSITDLPVEKPVLLPEQSDDRFLYHRLRDQGTPLSISSTLSTTLSSTSAETPRTIPPAMDIMAELKLINDLVTRRHLPEKLTASSVESSSKSSDSLTNIIPTTIRSSTSTSSNTLNNLRSSSSSINISTTPSKDADNVSTTERASPTPFTSPKPALAESDPFWWLPNGWRIDRTDVDRPLLLRFWSALSSISGSQAKV